MSSCASGSHSATSWLHDPEAGDGRRHAAKRHGHGGQALRDELAEQGIEVRAGSLRELPEEAPYAYKDVEEVVRVCEEANLARRVARLRPVGVVKG